MAPRNGANGAFPGTLSSEGPVSGQLVTEECGLPERLCRLCTT